MRRHFSLTAGCRLPVAIVVSCLALGLVAGGCSNAKDDKTAQVKDGDDHDHGGHHHHGDHPSKGPHGGQILEWGEHEFHLELVFDRAKLQATVYVLDHDMKKTEPTEAESVELKLDGVNELIPFAATPLEGETAEKSSRYVATHAALASKEPFSGRVTGKVKGKPNPYFASFEETTAESAKDEHDGDHDHPQDADHAREKDAHEKDAHEKDHKDDHDHAAQETPSPSTAAPADDAKAEAHGDDDHKDHQHEDGADKHEDGKHEDGKSTDAQALRPSEQLLYTSENLRMMAEDWERFWFMDQPDHNTPARHLGSGSTP